MFPLNGTDTAGTVNVNFGAGTYAGILANIDFSSNFNSTPHIEITPVGSNCAGMGYYVNRDTSSFSITLSPQDQQDIAALFRLYGNGLI